MQSLFSIGDDANHRRPFPPHPNSSCSYLVLCGPRVLISSPLIFPCLNRYWTSCFKFRRRIGTRVLPPCLRHRQPSPDPSRRPSTLIQDGIRNGMFFNRTTGRVALEVRRARSDPRICMPMTASSPTRPATAAVVKAHVQSDEDSLRQLLCKPYTSA